MTVRDAAVVYLEGELAAFEVSLVRLDRSRPSIYASGADWFDWLRRVRADHVGQVERTRENYALAQAAEIERGRV